MVEINVSNQAQVTLVEVSGRVDSMTANQMGSALGSQISDGRVHLVLDLSAVDYMSSAGLREIVTALKSVKRASGDLRIAQPSDRVREVLEMSGLSTIFRIYATQADAVKSY
ncbi:STAS domain-containing protein [Phototrophicus methaneseepsis]|uniref:Anti-sigma factor antagonist n=1 Tax=Phototrophicus methaneseepsis TaxID=2710758 RepID=A0A7S8E683_9CHLR|nr:STAS domain-containing protein [Phototrophicus methaneseepsis]QPC81019.1 STAS domain-containing protein [Phototrophicus methaneseepsis]